MAMRIDSTLQSLPGRVQEYIKDDVAFGRRSSYSEVAIPLNAELIARQERIDSQRAQIKSMEASMQSQADRIKELERESETHSKAYGLAIVERDNLRHELKVAQEGWRCECSTDDACRFARERDALRAQLAEIAATEPVAYRWVWKSKPHDIEGWCYTSTPPNSPELQEIEKLFTRPMPAQDVTELVEALEKLARLGNGEHYGNSDGNMIARDALSKYKGAK